MAKLTVKQFLDLLGKSGLAAPDRIERVVGELEQRRGGVALSDTEELIEGLIAAEIVTRWQSDQIDRGKYKGFYLGNYRLLSLLGSGGMSSVYLAEHKHMHQLRAVKILPKNRVNDSSYLDRFYLEARAAAALDHPNIVRAYDVNNEGEQHYMVMEYVKGKDLQTLVKDSGPLDYETAANYIAQAAEGLVHAHEAGLVHRDIKPANLLVDEKGNVKILDMGLALFADDERSSLTIAHNENVLGTADYLSPEQAQNSHNVDIRADIYSLGCTLYYLLTGHPPFPEGSLGNRIAKHLSQMPADIRIDRPECPATLVEICVRMIQKKPDDRFPNARDVADRLEEWLTSRGQAEEAAALKARTTAAAAGGSTEPGRPSSARGTSQKSAPRKPPLPVKREPAPPGFSQEDTLSDKARETFKGIDPKGGRAEPSRSSSKNLLVAKPLDKAQPRDSGRIDLGIDMRAQRPTGSDRLDSVVTPSPSSNILSQSRRPIRRNDLWIIGGIVVGLVVLLVIAIVVVLSSGTGEVETPPAKGGKGRVRDTSLRELPCNRLFG